MLNYFCIFYNDLLNSNTIFSSFYHPRVFHKYLWCYFQIWNYRSFTGSSHSRKLLLLKRFFKNSETWIRDFLKTFDYICSIIRCIQKWASSILKSFGIWYVCGIQNIPSESDTEHGHVTLDNESKPISFLHPVMHGIAIFLYSLLI